MIEAELPYEVVNRKQFQDMVFSEADRDLFELLFSSITWRDWEDAPQGIAELGWRSCKWHHRSDKDLDVDRTNLSIESDLLREGVRRYLANADGSSGSLDWYCADALAYMECIGTYKKLYWKLGRSWFSFASKPFAWVLCLGAAYYISGPVGAALVGVWCFFGTMYESRERERLNNLINEMLRVYDVFQTSSFSWETAWAELNRTRQLGAVWPGELYKLVESRRERGRLR